MRPSILAAVVGSTVLFQVPAAMAGTVEWSTSEGRALTWSSQTAQELKATLEGRDLVIRDDGARPGIGGGVVLHTYNGISIEVDRGRGVVQAVKKDGDGNIVRKDLFDAFAAGPSVFKKNTDHHVMVTMSMSKTPSASSLLARDPKAPERVLFHFEVAIYAAGTREVLDKISLAYDASTLSPAVGWQTTRDYIGDTWYLPYQGLHATSTWYTVPLYWASSTK